MRPEEHGVEFKVVVLERHRATQRRYRGRALEQRRRLQRLELERLERRVAELRRRLGAP